VPGFGNASGFELRILDRTGGDDLLQTAEVTNQFIAALGKRPEIGSAFTSFDPEFPQYMIHVDQAMAAKQGVSIDNAMSTLQTLLGSFYASNFIRFGQMYKVMVQASPNFRTQPEDVLKLHVKNDQGEMVPYSNFIKLERVYGPEQLTRYNMYTSAMINGDAAPGYSSGDAIKAIEETAASVLPRGFSFEWSGMTREQVLSGNQAIYIFGICLLFVYLLLAAQYESFLLPLPVLLSLPAGIFGAFLSLKVAGLENNIYAQVALVMLIGLLGKNAILIVEFAIQRQKQGLTVMKAAIEGGVSRLRPILMTSFAFIAGLIPLVIASGAGAMGNRSIGTAAAGGMLIGTVFGVIVIPGLYVLFAVMITMKNKKKVKIKPAVPAAVILIMLVAAGCSTPKDLQLPEQPAVPAAFEGQQADSTVSIGRLTRKDFFSDAHLRHLLDTAMRNNADALVAMQRMKVAQAQLMTAARAWLPSLDAVISGGANKYGDYTMDGVGNYDTNFSPNIDKDRRIPSPALPDYLVGLQSSWEIDLWGKLKNRKQAAYARFLASREGMRLVHTQLAAQVAGMYYQLMALDYEWEVIQKNIILQEAAMGTVKIQQEAGRANALAVQQFTAQLLNTRAMAYGVQQQRTQLVNQLNTLLGRLPQPVTRSSSLLEAPLAPSLKTGIPATMLQRRPDVQQSLLQLQAAKADVKAAKASFLPSVNLSAAVGYNAFKAGLLFNPGSIAYSILGSVTAPVFNKKQLKAQYGIATAEGLTAFYGYRQAVINGYQEVMTSLHRVSNAEQAFALKEKEVLVLKEAVSIAGDLFATGYANYLEVINTQKSVLEAELALAQYRKDVFLGTIDLYRALGGGTE
jgi:HAE1 family hydrophobic/amphiphilic exporter-1